MAKACDVWRELSPVIMLIVINKLVYTPTQQVIPKEEEMVKALNPRHLDELHRSGLTDETIQDRNQIQDLGIKIADLKRWLTEAEKKNSGYEEYV